MQHSVFARFASIECLLEMLARIFGYYIKQEMIALTWPVTCPIIWPKHYRHSFSSLNTTLPIYTTILTFLTDMHTTKQLSNLPHLNKANHHPKSNSNTYTLTKFPPKHPHFNIYVRCNISLSLTVIKLTESSKYCTSKERGAQQKNTRLLNEIQNPLPSL